MSKGMFRGRGRNAAMLSPVVKAKNTKETLLRLWKYLSSNKISLGLVFVMVLGSTLLSLSGPYLIGVAIDDYIVPGDFPGLFKISLLLAGIYIASASITWLQNYLMIGIGQKTVQKMREDLFGKLHSLPLRFFDNKPHGELMSRLTNDMDNISSTLNNSTTQIFSSMLTIIGTLSIMLWLSPLLTVLSLITIPLVLITTKLIARKTRIYYTQHQENLGELNGLIEETISGQRVIKVFAHEGKVISDFTQQNVRLKKVGIKAQIFSGVIPPIMHVINNLSFAIIAGVGGVLAVNQVITIGVIVSFINYSRQFTRPLNELANQFNMIQSAMAGAERVLEIIDEDSEREETVEETLVLERIKGEVSFSHVDFAYEKDQPVLKNFSLHVKAGETIALVGPTGAGKTTVSNLLTRFYDIDEGTITIDGYDIQKVQRKNLRSFLGVVLQDTYLFSETIMENIRYGRIEASDEEVKEAACLANAHNFIKRLPEGYETILSEDGGNLSHGQRQLISIARTILKDPAILILDEATSSIDTRTEAHIQEALLKLMQGRTSFVIAHRLSTIRKADLIVVIDGGQIVEQGNHEELLAQKGFYNSLYHNQLSPTVHRSC